MSEQDDPSVPIPAGPGTPVFWPECAATKGLSEIRELLGRYIAAHSGGRSWIDGNVRQAYSLVSGIDRDSVHGCDALECIAWWLANDGRHEALREADPVAFLARAIDEMARGKRDFPTIIPSVHETIVAIVREFEEIQVVRLLELVSERRPRTLQGEARGEVLAMLEDGRLLRTSAWSVRLFRCP